MTGTLGGPTSSINETITEETKKSKVNVYPNPMQGEGTIIFNLDKQIENGSISFFDISGKLAKTIALQNLSQGDQQIKFSTNDLSLGTYFVKLKAGNVDQVTKIIVLK